MIGSREEDDDEEESHHMPVDASAGLHLRRVRDASERRSWVNQHTRASPGH